MRRPFKSPMKKLNVTPPISIDENIENLVKTKLAEKEKHQKQQQQMMTKPKPKKIPMKEVVYNPEVHPLIASYLKRDGATELEVAEVIGVNVGVLRGWCRIHPEFKQGFKSERLAICETVTRKLLDIALGTELKDVEQMYEVRTHPVTRKKERVLVREKHSIKKTAPNALACFFYLQNRDASRWSQTGKNTSTSQFTPEQISTMMRTSSQAISDATLGEGLAGKASM